MSSKKLASIFFALSAALSFICVIPLILEHPGWDTIESFESLYEWLINKEVACFKEVFGASLITLSFAGQFTYMNRAVSRICSVSSQCLK